LRVGDISDDFDPEPAPFLTDGLRTASSSKSGAQ
jgi:hypothetical protein